MSSQCMLFTVYLSLISSTRVSGQRLSSESPPAPPGNVTLTVYHMFEPKYTGLADKDAGDYDGEIAFIWLTFNIFNRGNPEAAIGDNIFEMSTVNVTGWGNHYAQCNAPGCTGTYTCPKGTDYCCEYHGHSPTSTTLPGWTSAQNYNQTGRKSNGFWYSFPKESQGKTWTEVRLRRIKSACLAEAWRSEAGGCPDCRDLASQCTADCVKSALIKDGDDSKLKATWDKVFSNKTLCPEQPLPASLVMV